MTKSNITEYDNTAANNTDVQDVPLGENAMLPSNVNNAFREIMADLADINDGTVAMTSPSFASATVTGDLTVDTDTLHVDSTNDRIGIGTNSPSQAVEVTGTGARIYITGANEDIDMTSSADGQIHIDGNAYSGGIALNTVGMNIYTNSGARPVVFGVNEIERFRVNTSSFAPSADNLYDLGTTSKRFDDVRATNGTIQTSDQNEKQQIASLTDAEITAAKAISKLFKTFKWNDKVEEKGDAARTHTGVVSQQVQRAMTASGLDATKYAFWCADTWFEFEGKAYEEDEEAPEGATKHTRLGIRYPELLAFIGAATEQRLTDIETRLTALETE